MQRDGMQRGRFLLYLASEFGEILPERFYGGTSKAGKSDRLLSCDGEGQRSRNNILRGCRKAGGCFACLSIANMLYLNYDFSVYKNR